MDQISYKQASAELDRILQELRSDQCDIDLLTERTRRAVELLSVCRERLTATEQELASILQSLQEPQQ